MLCELRKLVFFENLTRGRKKIQKSSVCDLCVIKPNNYKFFKSISTIDNSSFTLKLKLLILPEKKSYRNALFTGFFMVSIFQKFTTQFSEKFLKESPKLQQNPKWNSKKEITLAALTTFSTFGAIYLAYQYLPHKINIPASSISNPIRTSFKAIGSLTALGLLASFANSKLQAKNYEQKKRLISLNSSSRNNRKSEEPDIINILSAVKEEKIDQNLLEEQINAYIDLSTHSPLATISNEDFIAEIANLIKKHQDFLYYNSVNINNRRPILYKILDILNVFTQRIDPLSLKVAVHLIPNIIPKYLYEMTKEYTSLEDSESRELIERTCQVVYHAITQQMKILFSDAHDFETNSMADEALIRILDLLTPFHKDDFRLSPNFYRDFIQHCPQFSWRFVQKYIFEYVINNKLPSSNDSSSKNIIANILNTKKSDDSEKEAPRYSNKNDLDTFKKIVIAAKLSLFLDNPDPEAASFAIQWMQAKLKIDPQNFELSPKDTEILKELYFDLCKTETLFSDLTQQSDLSHQGTQIANELINERQTTILANYLSSSNITQEHQTSIDKIASLTKKKKCSTGETLNIQILFQFIISQILDPSIPQRAELASLILNKYPHLFLNEKSVNLIKEAHKDQMIENKDLDSACQIFFTTWNTLNRRKSEAENEIEIPKFTQDTKEEDLPAKQIAIENNKKSTGHFFEND